MIDKIKIEKFGKFIDKEFRLAPVTIFYGKNEAGKTTLFDALFYALCSPGKNTNEGKKLHARYGDPENCRVQIEYSGDTGPAQYDPKEFLDLYAIRESDIKMKPDPDSEWMQRLKTNLFSGGIDPVQLGKEFEKRSNDTKESLGHNKKLKALKEERARYADELKKHVEKKESLLSDDKKAHQAKESLAELDEKITAASCDLSRLDERIKLQEKIEERKKCDRVIGTIEESEKICRELNAFAAYQKDETAEINRLDGEIKRLSEDVEKMKGEAGTLRDLCRKGRAPIAKLEEELRNIDRNLHLSETFRKKIEEFSAQQSGAQKVVWDKTLIILSAIVVCAGLVLSVIFSSVTLFLLGVISGAVPVFFARKIITCADPEKEGRFIQEIIDEVRNRSLGDITIASKRLDSIKNELYQKIDLERDNRFKQLDEKKKELSQHEQSAEKKEAELSGVVLSLEEKQTQRRRWFSEHNVISRDEYLSKRAQFMHVTREKSAHEKKQNDIKEETGIGDIRSLQRECERKIRSFDEEGIPREVKNGPDVRLLRSERAKAADQKKVLEDKKHAAEKDLERNVGRIAGSMDGIPEDIARLEKKIVRCDKDIDSIVTEICAAKMLYDIFGELAQGSADVLSTLGAEAVRQFGQIMTAWNNISVTGLNREAISVNDAGGMPRTAEKLSTGAQDAFVFCIRLILALRSSPSAQKHMLILDEPFRSLDPDKEKDMVRLLKKFYDDYGWQLMIFTFDERTAEHVKTAFGRDVLVNDLW